MFDTPDIIIIFILIAAIAFTYFSKPSNNMDGQFQKNREETSKIAKENREELTNTLERFENRFSKNIKGIQEAIDKQLKDIRDDNSKQLDKMRNTVDEKLQTTLESNRNHVWKFHQIIIMRSSPPQSGNWYSGKRDRTEECLGRQSRLHAHAAPRLEIT